MQIVIGTRGSKLAVAQAEYVKNCLKEKYPEDDFSLKLIKTKGDLVQDRSLSTIGGKGVFVREIERQLLDGEIQLAVHSMKDMPGEVPKGLVFAKAWSREDPRDVLVLREAHALEELRPGAKIGTGSRRRGIQLKMIRPDLEIVDIRGNVETRLAKMKEQQLDGIVLAAAGLIRLGKSDLVTQYLTPEQMVPAPAQGILGIELRGDRRELLRKVNALSDENTDRILRAERCFVREMGGDCSLPIGAYASLLPEGGISLLAAFGREDSESLLRVQTVGKEPEEAAELAVQRMKEHSARAAAVE